VEGILTVPLVLSAEAIDEDPGEFQKPERWRRFGQDEHISKYTKKGFMERLSEAGFQINERRIHFFGADQIGKAAITSQSVLYTVARR
jgi:hypothetical protein